MQTTIKQLLAVAALAVAAQSRADIFTIPVDVGLTRLVQPFVSFPVAPTPGLTMNGQDITLIYQLSRPIRIFSQTFQPDIVAAFDTDDPVGVPFGPIIGGALLDANGDAIPGVGGNILPIATTNEFTFGALWFPILPATPRPFLFYGVRFDYTMPNDPMHDVVGNDAHTRFEIAAKLGTFGIGFGKTDITGGPGLSDVGSSVFLLGIALAGLARFRRI